MVVVVDLASVRTALVDAGIDAAFPELDFTALDVIDRGFGSIVVGVPGRLVVRVPRTETVTVGHRRERALLPRIAHRFHVATPTVAWTASPTKGLPLGASAYRWIDGSQPVVPISASAPLVNDVAVFLATLHHTPISLVADIDLPDPRDLARTRSEDVTTIEPVLKARLSSREFSHLQMRLADLLTDRILDDFAPVLRHGDLWFGNLLIDEQASRLHAVLDWEHAAIGDPAEDIATQRYLGQDAATAVIGRYARLVGGLDGQFLRRADHHFALREISGIRRCLEMNDDDELDEEIRNLRTGPLLG